MSQTSIMSFASHIPTASIETSHFLDDAKSNRFDVDNNYISDQIGIERVRHAQTDVKPSELAASAAQKALDKIGMKAEQLDHIFFTGIEGDFIEPSTAHEVQKKIGGNAICFDIKNACLGFMSALYTASGLITSNMARYILICTGEKNSALTKRVIEQLKRTKDSTHFKHSIGFLTIGDSGGAVIVGPQNEGHKLIDFVGLSNGKLSKLCYYDYERGLFNGQMEMARICSATIKQHHQAYKQLSEAVQWHVDDIDWVVPHQVGAAPLRKFSQKIGIDAKKITLSYKHYGNLTTASMPVNMSLYEQKMHKGDKVYIAMSGSGICVKHVAMVFNG